MAARDVKLGYNTGYWSAGPPEGALEAVKEAERLVRDARRAQEGASASAADVKQAGESAERKLKEELARIEDQISRSAAHAARAQAAAAQVERAEEVASQTKREAARSQELAKRFEAGAERAEQALAELAHAEEVVEKLDRAEQVVAKAETLERVVAKLDNPEQLAAQLSRADEVLAKLDRAEQMVSKLSRAEQVAAKLERAEQIAAKAERSEAAAAKSQRAAADALAGVERSAPRAEQAAQQVSAEAAALRDLAARLEDKVASIESAASMAQRAAVQAQEAVTAAAGEAAVAREAAEGAEMEASVAKVQSEAARVHAQEAGRHARDTRDGSRGGVRTSFRDAAMPSTGTRRFVKPLRPKRLSKPDRELQPGFDDSDTPMARIELNGHFRELNARFSELVGYSEAEFQAATWPPVTDRENLARNRKDLRALMDGEAESIEVDTAYIHAQGLMVPVRGTLSVVKDEQGDPSHLMLEVRATQRA
jgi:PAS domain S-box-containing protein